MAAWIGLTGGIGSGKSQVAFEFKQLGIPHIDADEISRGLTAENGQALPLIHAEFGEGVFDQIGRLNRVALRDIVFKAPKMKEKLEALLFPLIYEEIQWQQNQYSQAVYGIVDIPLLIEKPLFLSLVTRVLVVDVCEATQIHRVRQRSGLGEEEILRIMATQSSRRNRCLRADDVLSNEGSVEDLAKKVKRLHSFYQFFYRENND